MNHSIPPAQPDLRRGLEILASRPLSLVCALILAVAMSVASFLVLLFPVIAGYYYAVRHSRREEYFIDLQSIFRNLFQAIVGAKRHFFKATFWGSPAFLRRPSALQGRSCPLLCPIPAALFHLLMALTYPLLASCAVSDTADGVDKLIEMPQAKEPLASGIPQWLLAMILAGAGGYGMIRVWGGPGFVGWVGLCFAFGLVRAFTSWSFTFRLMGFAALFIGFYIGGGILVIEWFGEESVFMWIGICTILLVLFQRKIIRTVFRGARDFPPGKHLPPADNASGFDYNAACSGRARGLWPRRGPVWERRSNAGKRGRFFGGA